MSDSPKPSSGPATPAEDPSPAVGRREFLNEISAAALGITGIGGAVVGLNFISPNVLFEAPARFHVGLPEDYPVNSVSFLREQQIYVVRTAEGFTALSAVCTHLGCITEWRPDDNLIACPCHGSRFNRDGNKVAGPAPRPLVHFSVQLAADGQLIVDKLNTVAANQVLKV
jgi:cytochrome b6-f complex iron-sulfur subunit